MTLEELKEKVDKAIRYYEDGDNEYGHAIEDDLLEEFIRSVDSWDREWVELGVKKLKELLDMDRERWYA